MTVIKLESEVKTNGRLYKRVFETENGYIYQDTSNGFYEVFHKKTTPVCIDFDNRIYSETEVKERYPKNEDFGKWAWVVHTLQIAKRYI